MSDSTSAPDDHPQFEQAVTRFEDAWQRGERPDLAAFVHDGPDRLELLVELVHIDLECRLKGGEKVRVETYLERFPEIAGNPSGLLDLIAAEYRLRRRRKPDLDPQEYLQRFPQIRAALAARLTGQQASRILAEGGAARALHLVCPHCRNPIEVVDAPAPEVLCPSCGSSFHLEPGGTTLQTELDGPRRLGKYELLAQVGIGAYGTVYEARDVEFDRTVAVKVPRSGNLADRQSRERFLAEGRAAAQLEHPGVVRVYDAGEHEGMPYLVSEYVQGVTLADLLTARRPGFTEAARLVAACAEALRYAHERGVVHRDVKPSNIMIVADGSPRLMDFGLAKRDAGEITMTVDGQVLGTPAYMSPEQARGEARKVDGRSDVYSLGVILYELLTGELPFRGNVRMLLHQVLNDEPRAPRTLNNRIPRDLQTICLKAMAKTPGGRYATAAALADDLARFLEGKPIRARPVSSVERVWRWCLRHPTAALLAIVIPTAILIGVWVVARAQANAELDRRTAELKENAAAQITDYLVRIFQSADFLGIDAPGFHGPGQSTHEDTLRRILKQGSVLMNEHLHDQPRQRADLLHAIGSSYRGLGDWEKAQDFLKESYELRKAANGMDHPDTLVSLQSLARLDQERGDYRNAIMLFEDILARRQKQLGPDHLLVAETRFYLAWAICMQPLRKPGEPFERHDLNRAEQLLLEVLRVREKELPPHHRDIGHVLVVLSGMKMNEPGQELAALGYAKRALDIFSKSEQNTLMGNAVVVFMQADGHKRAGRLTEAEAGFINFLKLTRPHLGDRHPLVVMQLWHLAGFYARTKHDLAAAERTAKEALEISRHLPQRNIPASVSALLQMADMVRTRDPVLAENVYREALEWAAERPKGNEQNAALARARLDELKRNQPKPKTVP